MAYKKIDQYFSFADMAIQNNADKNRSLIFLQKINTTIDWHPVETLLKKHYQSGCSNRGERAYSPLLLFKCILLQKWFQIKSDPELESQINDSTHTSNPIKDAYGDKGYTGAPNREFLALNNIADGIMLKDNINAKLTDFEIERNKSISKYRYIVEQYFGISHKHDNGGQARFTTILKNLIDLMFRQFAFNLRKGSKLLGILPV